MGSVCKYSLCTAQQASSTNGAAASPMSLTFAHVGRIPGSYLVEVSAGEDESRERREEEKRGGGEREDRARGEGRASGEGEKREERERSEMKERGEGREERGKTEGEERERREREEKERRGSNILQESENVLFCNGWRQMTVKSNKFEENFIASHRSYFVCKYFLQFF